MHRLLTTFPKTGFFLIPIYTALQRQHWRRHALMQNLCFLSYLDVCACTLSCFVCVWLFATLWTVACQALSVHRILQAKILEWGAMPSSRGSSWLRDQTCLSCGSHIAGRFFIAEQVGKYPSCLDNNIPTPHTGNQNSCMPAAFTPTRHF